MYTMIIPEGEEIELGTEEIFETTMTENFPQINARYQTTESGSTENSKQDKYQNKTKIPWHTIFKLHKIQRWAWHGGSCL